MRHIIAYSGGKDSTAMLLAAKENLESFEAVYCDTGWESQLTYDYLGYINDTLLDGKLTIIRSEIYSGFLDLCVKKRKMPSMIMRFCTEELKARPMKKYLNSIKEEKIVYQGIRAQESPSRRMMQPEGWDEHYGCYIIRPIFRWSAEDCFNIMKKYNVEVNPLYKMGFTRVGCFPCIFSRHSDLYSLANRFPEVIDEIRRLEELLDGKSYFKTEYIPEKYRNSVNSEGKKYASIDDILIYLSQKPDLQPLEDEDSCMSYYGLCGI